MILLFSKSSILNRRLIIPFTSIIVALLFATGSATAQLQLTATNNADALAQKLVGTGVTISNATLTQVGTIRPAGFFTNPGHGSPGLDSGIAITTGRLLSDRRNGKFGLNGNGTDAAVSVLADNDLDLHGDVTLATELGVSVTILYDAVVLEFDLVPLGDTVQFNYVMSSEEYEESMVCTFNDAFGFFISGPGITGNRNIALIPGTNTPVTITNINNIVTANCVNNPQYYIDNSTNTFFTHDGHTVVLTAGAKVIPCETYHLKIVIADYQDALWDSGVFIEAGSLTSNTIRLSGQTQTDINGNAYLAEGCIPGSFVVQRPRKEPGPLTVLLSYGGTAMNGTDIQALPSSVVIPANDSFVVIPVIPVVDGIPEGIETLLVYAMAGCIQGTPADSLLIQVRDFDVLPMTPDTIAACPFVAVHLSAPVGFSSYQWEAATTFDDPTAREPWTTPVANYTKYTCTAILTGCRYRDVVVVEWKDPGVSIFAGNDTIIAIGQPLQLYGRETLNAGLSQFSWSPADYLDDPWRADPVAQLPHDFRYEVEAITPGGCRVKDDIMVKVYKGPEIYVPTAFTPNKDGLNDVLAPVAAGFREFRYFRIYNRWGQIIFSTQDPYRGWDGTLNGTPQPGGTYVWVSEAIDYKGNHLVYRGIVTLIR